MSWIQSKLINLAGNITGVLGLSNGGTAKALTAAAGGVVWTDADSMEVGAAGTNGMPLMSNGTSAPAFGWNRTNSTAAAYVVTDTDGYRVVKLTGSTARTFTLPAASTNVNRPITFVNASTAILTITRAGSDTIGPGSETSITLAFGGDAVTLQSDGTSSWDFIGNYYQSYKSTGNNIASGGGTGGTYDVYAARTGKSVAVTIHWAMGSGSPGNSVDSQANELPSWSRPTNTMLAWNLLSGSAFTVIQVGSTGTLSGFSRTVNTTVATLGFTASTTYSMTMAYTKSN